LFSLAARLSPARWIFLCKKMTSFQKIRAGLKRAIEHACGKRQLPTREGNDAFFNGLRDAMTEGIQAMRDGRVLTSREISVRGSSAQPAQ